MSLTSQKYTLDVPANGALRLPVSGKFIRVISCLGAFDLATEKVNLQNVGIGDGFKDKPFTWFNLKDRSGAVNTITVVVSDEEFLNAPATSTSITQAAQVQTASMAHTAPAVGVATGQLVAANTARKYLLVQNVGAVAIWVRFGAAAAVTAAPSIRIPAGGDREWDSIGATQAVQAIAEAAGASVTVVEG